MFSQQSCFFLFDDRTHAGLFFLLRIKLLVLHLALSLEHCQLLLPKPLNLTLVFLLSHSAFLGVHLLQSFVFSKSLEQFLFEFVFHSEFFCFALGFQSHLEVFCLLQLLFYSFSLFQLSTLSSNSCLFTFLEIKFIAQVLLKLLFGSSLVLFSLETFENLITRSFSSIFSRLDLSKTLFLLFSVPAHHFVFELLHLLLSALESTFFVYAKNHIGLSLLHFQVCNASHFTIFVNHLLNNVINLFFLSSVLLVGFFFNSSAVLDLFLNLFFHAHAFLNLSCLFISGNLVLDFLSAEHNLINVCVLLLDK